MTTAGTTAMNTRAENPGPQTPTLFDLNKIDLRSEMVTREGLERWIPHRGVIVQVDGISWHDEEFSLAVGYKDVRDDEFWTEGHFPDQPIYPGVLQIEAGAQLSSFLFYRRRGEPCIAGFTRIEKTVFRGKVVPGDRLLILSRAIKYRPRLFVSEIQGIVEDRIVFESTITGMVM
ncbi:MAG: 3-hydroxyacyl-ACP dehydratase FabZ family protein [Planctomycetota bacterium]|jgi:3-hydroxyacyl-[acyl-carrier-protein] dehydratase